MNIHKRLKMYTVPVLLIKALLVIGIHELQIIRKAKRSAVTRVSLASSKVVITDFSSYRRVILVDMPRGKTVNSDLYITILKALQKRFTSVRSQKKKKYAEILHHHNNTSTHTSLKTQETITKVEWTVLPQPPHSSAPTPSDFHLFRAHRDTIRGKRFRSDDEVMVEAKLLRVRNRNWYKKGGKCPCFSLAQGC